MLNESKVGGGIPRTRGDPGSGGGVVTGSRARHRLWHASGCHPPHAADRRTGRVRAMLPHPLDGDAARFYTRFGFIASPLREQQLLLLLNDARRWVK